MTTLYKWRIYCNTDGINEYVWNDDEPTICPSNPAHSIDSSKTTIEETHDPNVVKIEEESTPTGGNYKAETLVLTTNAGETNTVDKTWLVPVNMFAVHFATTTDHEGDEMDIDIAPDTLVAATTASVAADDTTLTLNDVSNLYIGYYVKIADETNTDDLGMITAIDKINKTITVNTPAVNAFSAGAGISMTVRMVERYELGPAGQYSLGENNMGGSYIPPGAIARLKYTNNGVSPIKFVMILEYLY